MIPRKSCACKDWMASLAYPRHPQTIPVEVQVHRIPAIRLLFLSGVLSVLLASVGCRPAPAPYTAAADQTQVNRLLHLMEQRLGLMHDVALWKWNSGQPITDPKRESELLDKVVERGRQKGLDPELVRSFFSAQMEGARSIQQTDFDRWATDKPKPNPSTLTLTALRQQIDTLNGELIDALAVLSPRLTAPSVQHMLKVRATDILGSASIAPVREIVLAPLAR